MMGGMRLPEERSDQAVPAYLTSHDPNPNLFESQMDMVGRMGRTGSPRRRLAARVFAGSALLPFLVAGVAGLIGLVREML